MKFAICWRTQKLKCPHTNCAYGMYRVIFYRVDTPANKAEAEEEAHDDDDKKIKIIIINNNNNNNNKILL